ncbi:MAG TPA: STAS domain-containing protein [Micromonosporaceae bacterium]
MAFAIRERRQDVVAVLALTGELDMASAPVFQEHVDALVAAGKVQILVDVAELSFCDSAGLNAFIRGDRLSAAEGGWLRLTGAQGHVARVIELSGLHEVLTYRPEDDEALRQRAADPNSLGSG